jgi:hypothetical protein
MTRSQEIETAIKEHELSLIRLEKSAEKNSNDMATMKSQMDEILKNLQLLNNGRTNRDESSSGVVNNSELSFNRNNRLSKVDFPRFHGEDVEGWNCKVEHFFSIDETPEHLKIRYAVVHFDGAALQWHQWFVKSRGGSISRMTWKEYVEFVTTRFADVLSVDAMGTLAALRQTGLLKDFCQEFDLWLNKVSIPEEYSISLFLRAIKPEIGGPVRLLRPKSLPEAYLLARMQDDANSTMQSGSWKGNSRNLVSSSFPAKSVDPRGVTPFSANKLPLLPTPSIQQKKPINRRLTSKEMDEKRAKGECFWCNEKFSPTHV